MLNLPNHSEQFLHFLYPWWGSPRQVGEVVQLGQHLLYLLPVVTVFWSEVILMVRDEGSHRLGGSLDVGDIFGPEGSAGVALVTGREC